jgi:hypothetical protein
VYRGLRVVSSAIASLVASELDSTVRGIRWSAATSGDNWTSINLDPGYA